MSDDRGGGWCGSQMGKTLYLLGRVVGKVESWRQNHEYWQLGVRETGGGWRWPDAKILVELPSGDLKYDDWLEAYEIDKQLQTDQVVEYMGHEISKSQGGYLIDGDPQLGRLPEIIARISRPSMNSPMKTLEEPIRQDGYLVFQDSVNPTFQPIFHKSQMDAENFAIDLLNNNVAVFVIPTVRFSTQTIESRTDKDR